MQVKKKIHNEGRQSRNQITMFMLFFFPKEENLESI